MRVNVVLVALILCAVADAELKVTNHANESVVRYPCILLKGTCRPSLTLDGVHSPKDATSLSVMVVHGENLEGRVEAAAERVTVDVHGKQFKALVPLAVGPNEIQITDEISSESTVLKVTYKPQSNPYYVRLIWLTDVDGDTTYATAVKNDAQNYAAKLRTAGLLMQTATAEKMHDIGRDRKTFRLQHDASGQVVVHTWKAPKSRDQYYEMSDQAWWRETWAWVNQAHPDPYAKNVVLASFTRKDVKTGRMKAHTALGGGNLGLFGSASVFSWPNSINEAITTFKDSSGYDSSTIHNDSAGRNRIWGLASTTLGATLHETGHTFGLPHCTDRYGVMTRGFDQLNRVFTVVEPPSDANPKIVKFNSDQEARFGQVSASYLQLSPWFQPDGPSNAESIPKLKFDPQTGVLSVSAETGIAWIGVHSGSDIHGFIEYSGDDQKKRLEISMEQLVRTINGQAVSRVEAVSASGQAKRISL